MSARPAVRAGDLHVCPEMAPGPSPHAGGPVVEGSPNTFINRRPAARSGDPTACSGPPGEIDGGSSGVYVNRQAAARIADAAGHDGRLADGSSNVHIGDHGRRGGDRAAPPGQAMSGQLAFILHADYDRQGGLQATTSEHGKRLLRPGAILLPNLDLEEPVPVAGARDRVPHLDAYQDRLRSQDEEVSHGVLEISPYGPVSATRAELVVHPADANRIRVFGAVTGAPILGIRNTLSGPRAPGSTRSRYPIDGPSPLWIQAVALAGDPSRRGARGMAPQPPSAAFPAEAAAEVRGRLHGTRAPGEIWMEIEHTGAGATHRDVGLFTIAPFLLTPNTQPVEVLYVIYTGASAAGSHPTVYDICEACADVFGTAHVDMPPPSPALHPTSVAFIPHTPPSARAPDLRNKKVHVIGDLTYQDRWIQDQVLTGYCKAPHATLPMVVQCRRSGLAARVREDLPADGLGFYDGLRGSGTGPDWGGNIEVSPPVAVATPAMRADAAGPSMAAHPPAPLGKIIFGDCTPRPASRVTREFLLAQRVQPVLPVDTSWLTVGHVDEIMSTVPDRRGGGFKLLVASAHAMTRLLEQAAQLPRARRTAFHRGKYEGTGSDPRVYAELEIEDLLSTPVSRYAAPSLLREHTEGAPPPVTVKAYNEALQTKKLKPLALRLQAGLGLGPRDLMPIPMYFKVPNGHQSDKIVERHRTHVTSSLTAGCVNLQVIDDIVLVGRPFGPRLAPDDARQVLANVLPSVGLGHCAVRLGESETYHWSPPREENWRVYAYFARLDPTDRARLVEGLRSGGHYEALQSLSPAGLQAIGNARSSIEASNQDNQLWLPSNSEWSMSFGAWRRTLISEGTVDLIESYLVTALEPLGLTPRFVDAWSYHTRSGSVHCGTNVRRTPPAIDWWDHYDPTGEHWRYSPNR